MSWQVDFFKNNRGDSPVEEFIKQQDEITYAKIIHSVDLVKNNGIQLRPPYVKKIRNNVWELRISGKNAVRILYCIFNNKFYFLHAFKKKTNKTPLKEIKIALDRSIDIV